MRWASAAGDGASLESAIEAAIASVQRDLGRVSADLAVVFVSHHWAAEAERVPALLGAAFPSAVLLGCTAGGVIGGGHEVEESAAVALTVAHLPGVVLTPFTPQGDALPDADASPHAWHEALGVAPGSDPHFVVLADPFSFPVDTLLAGLDYAYPRATVVGGMASGSRAPGGNTLYCGDRMTHDGAAGIALSGNVRIETIVAQGCRAVGPSMRITRCHENLLLELDGRSPLAVIQQMLPELGEKDRALAARSLMLGIEIGDGVEGGDEFLVRNLVGVDPERGILAIGERLREGQVVRFVVRDAATSAEDLTAHLQRFADRDAAAGVRGALLFSCLGRGQYLYGAADHDTDLFRRHVGAVPLGGFFCNGEIGPVGGATRVHGYTSAFGLFRDLAPDSHS